MRPGASTPEELETLFEDAFVTRDRDALAELFDGGAVLFGGHEAMEARGAREIRRHVATMCDRGYTYVANPQRVLQSRHTTLLIAERAVNVMRRGRDGSWRYAISLLNIDNTNEGGTDGTPHE
jgi:ketosteroid isomerase-like protein